MGKLIDYEKELREEERINFVNYGTTYRITAGGKFPIVPVEKINQLNRINQMLDKCPQEEFINRFFDYFIKDNYLDLEETAFEFVLYLSDKNMRKFVYSSHNFSVYEGLKPSEFMDYCLLIFTIYYVISIGNPNLLRDYRCDIEAMYSKLENFKNIHYKNINETVIKPFFSFQYLLEESIRFIVKAIHIDFDDLCYIYEDRDQISYEELEESALEYMRYIYDLLNQIYNNTKEYIKHYINQFDYWNSVSNALEYEVGGILWHLIPEEYYERFKKAPVLLKDTGGFDNFKTRCLKILKEDFYV